MSHQFAHKNTSTLLRDVPLFTDVRVAQLPLQSNEQNVASREFSSVRKTLSQSQQDLLQRFGYEEQISEDSLAHIAWAVLLNRYGAGQELIFNEQWVAYLETPNEAINAAAPSGVDLPIRLRLDRSKTAREVLPTLLGWQRSVEEHVRTFDSEIEPATLEGPLTKVTYWCRGFQPERFALDPESRQRLDQLAFQSQTPYPLNLNIENEGDSFSVSLRYDTGLYDAPRATQLLDDFCHILTTIAGAPDKPLNTLDFLTPQQRVQLIDQQCDREQFLSHQSALQRILGQCDTRPDELAVSTFDGSSVTYGELGQQVRQLAANLQVLGVNDGDIVALHVRRSIETIIAMLAINTAGAAFLPLDVNSPMDRRLYMLDDAEVELVLVDGIDDLDTDIKTLNIKHALASGQDTAAAELPSQPAPSDGLAYVIYTSGSTGKPKGVCIEHGSLANHVAQTGKLFELTPKDRSLQFASIAFDSSMEEVFATLAFGASLWLRTDDMAITARAFFDRVEQQNLTVITLTTAFWHQLVHSGIAWPESVRLVLVGGERADPGLHLRFRQSVGEHVRFINSYGPTETTIACTCYVDSEGDHDSSMLPIGRPMGGASCFVLNGDLEPVPPGVAGQLYVGGAGLARGYLNREALTAERFIEHPFRRDGRLYATGDIVRQTPRGNLVYIDRVDNQVKVQGFRVELGEIETCLRSHQAIEEAVVVPLHLADGGGAKLIAFVQVPDDKPVTEGDLREFVADNLPPFMMPRRFELLSQLPQTPAGKVDRQTLTQRAAQTPQQETNEAAEPESASPTSGTLEQKLLRIWSDMLGHQVTDTTANFFDIGGDSLMAMRLFTELERELQLQCNPHDFFKDPTVETLAKLNGSDHQTDFKAPLLTLNAQPENVRPLFFAPTVSGQVADYFHLVGMLDDAAPMYGLQMSGLRSGDEIHDNLRDAAKFYVEQMRTVQPQGPYSLAGYSAGGTVCLAIAEELHDQGEKTDLLLMLDAVPTGITIASPLTSPRRLWRISCTLVDRIKELFEGDNFFGDLVARAKPVFQRVWAKVWPWAKEPDVHVEDLFTRSGMSELTAEESARMQAHLDTTINFQARRYPLDVVVIRSPHDPFEGPFEFDLCWKQAVTGNIQVEVVRLRHNDFLNKNHIAPVAAVMKRYLSDRTDANV